MISALYVREGVIAINLLIYFPFFMCRQLLNVSVISTVMIPGTEAYKNDLRSVKSYFNFILHYIFSLSNV